MRRMSRITAIIVASALFFGVGAGVLATADISDSGAENISAIK